MKKILLSFVFLLTFSQFFAQIPDGYYDGTDGLTGDALKSKLRTIITSGHNVTSYSGLWTAYATTDVYPAPNDNTVWDIYSSYGDGTYAYSFTISDNQCGTYSVEGDCYNREHTVPQSWFNGESPMYSDLFIVYPTDGKVNGQRSSYPYGEVGSASWTSQNGSKLGTCDYPGYSSTVFEPIDAYKGDIARSYFYDVTRYDVSSWTGASFSGDGFSSWTLAMLLEWNELDPVSQKEIDRNNEVYDVQNNRNPYIDHPEWVCDVFGGSCGNTVNPPENLVAQGVSPSQIDLSWALNGNNDDIVLAYNTTNTFGTPSGTYTAGQTITGGGEVLVVGNGTSFSHTGLSSQIYYYKIWSYDGTDYSTGVEAFATPLQAEPTNHVTNFTTFAPTAYTISVSWTDAIGTVTPSGYLIKANYSGSSISVPTDGQPQTDGLFTKNVAYGVQTIVFDGLNQNTTYDFEIFPYSNSGSDIDYKTDGTIPQASGTTTDMPTECGNENFDGITTGSGTYATGTFVGQDGSTWDYTDSRTDQSINGASICVRDGYVQSGTIANGISDITISAMRVYSGDDADLTVLINDTPVGTIPYTDAVQTTTISGINIAEDIVIKIETPGTGDRVVIDDIIWGCYGSGGGNDSDTEIENPTTQIPASTILSTETGFIDMFAFSVTDLGTSDGLSTYFSSFMIYPKLPENTANFANSINAVKVSAGGSDISLGTVSITNDFINIPFSSLFEIADNSYEEFTVSFELKNDQIIDNSVLAFMIDADNTGFVADNSGSTFNLAVNSGNDIVSNAFSLEIPESINETSNDVKIYPNPSTNGVFYIISDCSQATKIVIYDVNGKEISTQQVDSKTSTVDISNSQNGLYFIKIESEKSIIWKKIIKN